MNPFIQWLAEQSVTTAIPGQTFQLASGRQSTYYLDLKSVLMHPKFLRTAIPPLWRRARTGNYQLVSGMATAAIPLVSAVIMYDLHVSSHTDPGLEGFYLRGSQNDHGTKRQIEYTGSLTDRRVLVLEDVVTTGKSSMDAVNALRAAGAIVEEVMCVVDREEGGRHLFEQNEVRLTSLYTGQELRAAVE